MAKIIAASIDVTKIDKSKLIKGKKGTYLNINITLNDEADNYGNHASISIGQSQEEREAKASKVYLGNGKVVWSNEGDKPQQAPVSAEQSFGSKQDEPTDDLPF